MVRSDFPVKAVCLFIFFHKTVPQNVFSIKLVSEEAGQTSLEKAGQRVFRWTEQAGAAMDVSDALGQHGHLGTLTLPWLSLLIQCVHVRALHYVNVSTVTLTSQCMTHDAIQETMIYHVLIKPLMQCSAWPKRASISYNPQPALSLISLSPACFTSTLSLAQM